MRQNRSIGITVEPLCPARKQGVGLALLLPLVARAGEVSFEPFVVRLPARSVRSFPHANHPIAFWTDAKLIQYVCRQRT